MDTRVFTHYFFLFILIITVSTCFAQTPPTGFASTTVSGGWTQAVGLAFSDDGTDMFVWERGGKVYVVRNNQRQLILDISEEVLGFYDHGMLGFALHPQFNQNGYFYLFYLVDRHHLINYGTPAYNPLTNEYNNASIGRLTRYTAVKTQSGYTVNPASRKILIGATKQTGIPSTNDSHVIGSILFGTDGTLLVGTGDGAGPYYDLGNGWNNGYYAQALADGIITPAENIGTFRSQLLESHSGKLLRIDPETGEGIPSNPFYDPARPSAAISRVYALGIRQPFKMILKQGTGSHNPADGNPGTIYMGDVGYDTWEEINVIDRPGLNLGWPVFEGLEPSPMSTMWVDNVTAPNPLYPASGCRQFFRFQELIKQATPSGQASFPNPCNAGQNIPASIKTFVHHRPIIEWRHDIVGTRTGIFTGQTAGAVSIGPGAPVTGTPFTGSAAVGGVFYPHSDFPPEYQNEYFFGDYGSGWIRNLDLDENDKPVQVRNFINSGIVVVGMAVHPTEGGLYYIHFGSPGEIRKVIYSSNQPPVAAASVDQTFGASPLIAHFTGSNSIDSEGQPLSYEWNFGDGTPLSTEANPTHTFTAPSSAPIQYTVTLKVTDNLGVFDQTTLSISLNNTPPEVTIDSPPDGTLYPLTQETTYALTATVHDNEHSLNQLAFEWQTILHHNIHEHPNAIDTSPTSSITVDPLGCDGQTYYYRVILKVTDPVGASTIREITLHPDCAGIPKVTPLITWSPPATLPVGTVLSATELNATATHNGSSLPGTLVYTPPLGTVLALGDDQQFSVTFTPSNTSLYNPASKTVMIDVVPPVTPVITWPTPAQITVGTALSATQLNATASYNGSPVAGIFVYTPPSGTVLGLGNAQQLSVSFTPANTVSYNSANANVLINVVSAPSQVFYRALNLNGAALTIDGNPFQASVGAPNFSFTNGTSFANQNVTLVPATDANRAAMIRSSIYGGNVGLSIGAIPSGTYQVWLYVWEDNNTETFSISLEGAVVQSNVISGSTGAWQKLGPYTRAITDGTINITANGGAANLSGVEIWSVVVGNQPPVVANAIPDQTATEGTTFSYSFPSNTFSDPNAGTVFTYSVSLSNDNPLPAWLTFNATARTFSGTPGAAAVGQLNVRVTASDGAGGSVNDTFLLTVSAVVPVTPVITWATPSPIPVGMALGATQLNATAMFNGSPVPGMFVYTPPSGSVLSLGNGQQLSVTFTPTNNVTYTTANKTVMIDVVPPVTPLITWATPAPIAVGTALSSTQLNATASYNGSPVAGTFVYTPPSGSVLAIGNAHQLSVTFTPSNALLYTEASGTVAIDVTLITPVITWLPPAAIPVGTALSATQLNATATYNGSPVSGTFVYTPPSGSVLGLGNAQQLSVAFTPDNTSLYNPANKTVTINVVPLVTPVITWSPAATLPVGTVLSATHLNATATNNGSPVAGTFLYTPPVGTVLALGDDQEFSVTFTPDNTSLYSPASKTVMIDVVPPGTPAITWPTPAQITVGTALSATQLNATASYNGSPVAGIFVYTPPSGTVLGIGNAQQLSVSFTPTNTLLYNSASANVLINVVSAPSQVFFRALNLNGAALTIDGNLFQASVGAANFSFTTNGTSFANQNVTLIPATDANRTTMIRSSIYGRAVTLSIGAIPSGTYQVWLYVWEDNITETFSISLEGAVVQSNIISGSTGAWQKLGPYTRAITDGTISIAANGGTANLSGVEIWSVVAGGPNQPPVVANVIPDQTATQGTAFSYTFPANTFSDPNAGTVLTYSANLSNDSPLPAWLTFNASTRTFSGTPGAIAVGPWNVRVTASDGAGGSVNDIFLLTVNPVVPVTPVITWATPSPIPVGTALGATQLNATASFNGSPVPGMFVYTPPSGTVLSLGNAQQLSVTFTPTNNVTYTTANRTVMIDVVPPVTPVITWATPSPIPVGTALSSTQLNATAAYNGSPVAGTFVYTPPSGTVLALGNGQQLSVVFTPNNSVSYTPANRTVTINVVPVSLVTPIITWATPAPITVGAALSATQLNATASYNGSPVAGTFVYTPPSGTVLPLGNAQQLSVAFTPNSPLVYSTVNGSVLINVVSAPARVFYRALNLNGVALTIDGNPFQASAGAANFSFTTNGTTFANQTVPLIPTTDANRATMIRSSIYGGSVNLSIGAVPTGNYEVWLYVWEDNFTQTYSISLEGTLAQSNIVSGNAGVWRKLGPYTRTISDGTINIAANGGHANLSGVEIWRLNPPAGARIADEVATEILEEESYTDGMTLTAYPNPSSGKVNISFSVSEASPTQLAMYDIRGIRILLLFEGGIQPGKNEDIEVEVEVPDGVYVLQLVNGRHVKHYKLAMAR